MVAASKDIRKCFTNVPHEGTQKTVQQLTNNCTHVMEIQVLWVSIKDKGNTFTTKDPQSRQLIHIDVKEIPNLVNNYMFGVEFALDNM